MCIYFGHIPTNRVISGIFYTPVEETIIDSKIINILMNQTL